MSGAADGSIMADIITTHAPMKPAAPARSGPVDIVFIAMLLGEAVWARNAIQAATVTAASDTPMRTVALSAGKRTLFSGDRKSTRLNSSHQIISYAVFCLKKKK